MLLIRSLFFDFFIYLMMLIMFIVLMPVMLWSRAGAHWVMHRWCELVKWALRVICGMRTEVRGTPPEGQVMIAAKHQSWLDIIMIADSVPSPSFIMKKQILITPLLGFVAKRIGCVAVDRGKGGAAVQQMLSGVNAGKNGQLGQLIIYPQGTRIPPGEKRRYKTGAGILYEEFGMTCHPVAVNTGVFWGRNSIWRRPGVAVIEYLDPIPAGLPKEQFMEQLEVVVEAASEKLLEEGRSYL